MTISYPVSLPTSRSPARVSFDAMSVVGVAQSPFTAAQQVYAHQGEWFEAQVELPPMERADAEEWIAFLLSLNGREGTFLLGDPASIAARGTWSAGAPKVNGAGQTGKTLAIKGLADGLTALKGDWLQLGTGATSRLHKVVVDASIGGSPSGATLDIWPRIRTSPADGDAIVVASPKGLFRLKDNRRSWSIGEAKFYGLSFSCIEAL